LLSLHRKATARQAQPRPGLPRRAAAGAAAEPPPTAQEAVSRVRFRAKSTETNGSTEL